jgi:hypothetical protein
MSNRPAAVRTDPRSARWCAWAAIGRNVPGGTETSEVYGYFTADAKPGRLDIRPRGWRTLEFTVRAIPA